jgi:predicted phage terminase large subunit-like protein
MNLDKLPSLNMTAIQKIIVQKQLYEFVKYFWDTFDGAEFKDLWLLEYQAECFQYSVRESLPKWIKDDWISDDEYENIKLKTGGACPIRDHKDRNNHDWNMPPRHSKSTTHNVCGPVWLNTLVPKEIASVSHIQDLATDFNLKRQKILNSVKFKTLFGDDDRLKIIKNTSKEITLAHGGKLYSVNMSGFTGFGADIIINDDIVSSEHARKDKEVLANARSYWTNTLPTRRNQGDSSIIWNIMQRLAPGDVSGMIENSEELSAQYTKTVIKAIATEDETIIYPCSGKIVELKKGDYLWKDRFDNYQNLRNLVGHGTFETQYQQNAINSELTYIKRHMIKWITYDEYLIKYVQNGGRELTSFDFPVKGKDESDKTGCVYGRKYRSKLAIIDAFEERMGYPEQKKYVTNLSIVKPSIIQIYEDKANGSVLIQDLELEVPGIVPFEPGSKSKDQRLDIASTYVQNGNVEFVLDRNGEPPKNLEFLISRLCSFPFVQYDDVVDAFSQIVLYSFTDAELKIYGMQFDEDNIVDDFDARRLAIDLAIHKSGNVWKLLEVARNYAQDEFIVIREHLLRGKTNDVIPHILNIAKGKRIIYESGKEVYNLLMGKIPIQPNYTKISRTILSVRNGFSKKRIKIMRSCHNTITDIETFRYSRESFDRGDFKPVTLDDGFAGCLRVIIASEKGEDAVFY